MLLGEMISRFENDQSAVFEAIDDVPLFARVCTVAERFGETPGDYVAGALRRFANSANPDDWLSVVGAAGRSGVPGKDALQEMVRWAIAADLKQDQSADDEGHECSCGGSGACQGG